MIVPDVNLLLYANVAAYPQHEAARAWWEGLLNGDVAVGLCTPVVFGFVRIATNRRVYETPMTVEQATSRVERWLERSPVSTLVPGPRHLEVAFGLLRGLGTAQNLTTDAEIAAYAIEYQGEVHSNDADFARFPGLRWHDPLAVP